LSGQNAGYLPRVFGGPKIPRKKRGPFLLPRNFQTPQIKKKISGTERDGAAKHLAPAAGAKKKTFFTPRHFGPGKSPVARGLDKNLGGPTRKRKPQFIEPRKGKKKFLLEGKNPEIGFAGGKKKLLLKKKGVRICFPGNGTGGSFLKGGNKKNHPLFGGPKAWVPLLFPGPDSCREKKKNFLSRRHADAVAGGRPPVSLRGGPKKKNGFFRKRIGTRWGGGHGLDL